MPDILTFADGTQASAATVNAAFEALSSEGQSILNDIAEAQQGILLSFEQGLNELQARQQRVLRLLTTDVAAKFIVSDFLDVNQTLTTATVRVDSQAVSLRERSIPSDVIVQNQTFRADHGSVEQFGSMYRVSTTDASTPVGTFDLQLTTTEDLIVVVFDIVSAPGTSQILVQSSLSGVTYTNAQNVSQNGSTVTAWLSNQSVRYLRVQITPALPDSLGGRSFTFGLTNFRASDVSFHLQSELLTNPIAVFPRSNTLQFVADGDPGIEYFISWDGTIFNEVQSGDIVAVPGAPDSVVALNVGLDSTGLIAHSLSPALYASTLRVTSPDGVTIYRLAPGLGEVSGLTNSYICWKGQSMFLQPYDNDQESGNLFNISYQIGPTEIVAYLKIRLSTSDASLTPVFRGATLLNQ